MSKYRTLLEQRLSNRNLDFSLVEAATAKDKVKVSCPLHGYFEKTVQQLMRGAACPACDSAYRKTFGNKVTDTETFIRKSTYVHNDRYDYAPTVYSGFEGSVEIICPEHGLFTQKAKDHLSGKGCYRCKGSTTSAVRKCSTSEFIEKAQAVHGATYDYSMVVYKDASTAVDLICRTHGVFSQAPSKHLSGQGCAQCAIDRQTQKQTQTAEELLQRCVEAHNGKYTYEKADFALSRDKIIITCPEHGDFQQAVNLHYQGQGCPKCANERIRVGQRKSGIEFVMSAVEVHGNVYRYRLLDYVNSKTPVEIACGVHGSFYQRPNDHLDGHGCPTCARVTRGRSKSSSEFGALVKRYAPDAVFEYRISKSSGKRWRMDVYIPSKNLGFEFNGLRWHSTRFIEDPKHHYERQRLAALNGTRLVFIHEDEWLYRKPAVEDLVRHLLGKSERAFARKCTVKALEPEAARTFHEQHHIQGCRMSPEISYGLTDSDGILIACMSFNQKTSDRKNPYAAGRYELVRFSSSKSVIGGASRLFRKFISDHKPSEIVSFSMNHLFTGGMYEKLGFKLDKVLPIDYTYVEPKQIKRLHKSNFQHKRLKQRFENYDPNQTEELNCKRNNFYRIYDCGKKRWLWKA